MRYQSCQEATPATCTDASRGRNDIATSVDTGSSASAAEPERTYGGINRSVIADKIGGPALPRDTEGAKIALTPVLEVTHDQYEYIRK